MGASFWYIGYKQGICFRHFLLVYLALARHLVLALPASIFVTVRAFVLDTSYWYAWHCQDIWFRQFLLVYLAIAGYLVWELLSGILVYLTLSGHLVWALPTKFGTCRAYVYDTSY